MLDLDFDLQGAFLAAGFRRNFGDGTIVVLFWICLGADLTALAESDFGEVGFVDVDFDLEVLQVSHGEDGGAGAAGAAEALRGDEFAGLGEFFEYDAFDG